MPCCAPRSGKPSAAACFARNPADAVTPPQPEVTEQRALTPDEVRRLLEAVQGHRLFALLFLALSTGMREGELLGLRWEDVDLEGARLTVRVQRQYLPRTGMVERRTKAYRQDRPVELTDAEVAVLREHRKRQVEERLAAGELWRDHGLVFPGEVGTPLNPRNLLRWFQGLLARAGLPDVRFHDLRHTAATLLLRSDGRVLVVQQRLGHRDPATTTRFYGHVLPGDQRAAAEKALTTVLGTPAASRKEPPREERVANG